ncbi:hypothetical protein [Dysgonomonas sp. 520]|uniref:hypothetical protein n=1 Tax=Dysgonomonas sp. 520 TaxID=2302931 RepID=UPI0013D8C627|nr:hypothetical protein [Dysgonomonas sp. 520]NDW10339.1 hypothetical protein [Dysgonomonas sp. 520]
MLLLKTTLGNLKKLVITLILMSFTPSLLWAVPPLIIPNDVITVEGGVVSPDNPDVYEIDKGFYVNGTSYTLTLMRPQGAGANYPVRIEYTLQCNIYDNNLSRPLFWKDKENEEFLDEGVLEFAAGEITKTLAVGRQRVSGTMFSSSSRFFNEP